MANHNMWMQQTGGDPLRLKDYQGSNRYIPLQIFDDSKNSTPFIELFVPPLLHLVLGKFVLFIKQK